MFKKFFKFLKGYVIIEIYGKNAERFINICLRRGIEISGTKPLGNGIIQLAVYKRDFGLLRSVAWKTKTAVKIKSKRGLYNIWSRYKKRYAFAVGFFAFIMFIAVMSQFIWVVEINGVENADYDKIIEALENDGVKSGSLKKNLPSGIELKRDILNANDDIAWAWVYIEGAKARVEIYEKTLPPQVIDKSIACNVSARRDGVIKRIVAKGGELLLNEGDAVSAGDVIISGKVGTYREGEPEKYIYVHALGVVEAYTCHVAEGDYRLYYQSRIPTGDRKTYYSLELFGKKFDLFRNKSISYEEFDKIEIRHELSLPIFGYTGISLNVERYDEVSVHDEPISEDTAIETAKTELEEKISKELFVGSKLINSELKYERVDSETLHVKLIMNFTENIGVETPTEE
jgi:similar to stage IV sporulation protein